MSDADKEQRYKLIEDRYGTVRADVTAARNVSADDFDEWIETTLVGAQRALDTGLVDKIGRWDDLGAVIKELEGEKKRYIPRSRLLDAKTPSTLWGEDPEIAVVYALGLCDMDRGIKARKLDKLVQYGQRVWGIEESDPDKAADMAIEATVKFFEETGVPTRLADYDLKVEDCMAAAANIDARGATLGEHGDLGKKEIEEILALCG